MERRLSRQPQVTIIYNLTEDNALDIIYKAETDKTTILNLTNHSYFNLSGQGDPSIGDHLLMLNAEAYLPTDETAIPYGDPQPVKDTPMDFTEPFSIGERINDDFEQLHFGNGYDHTFVLDKPSPEDYAYAGICESPKTGIKMESIPLNRVYSSTQATG